VSTAAEGGAASTPEIEEAWRLEERIRKAIEEKRFLVLSVAPKYLLRAERELLRRFPLQRVSLETLLIEQMRTLAQQAGASWEVVLRADNAERESKDWRNLITLVRRAVPAVEDALLRSDKVTLLVYPGLLARYEQLDLLDRLRDASERQQMSPGFLLLLPVVLASQWGRLTDAWIANSHRAAQGVRQMLGA
jgi:hypothetical protein